MNKERETNFELLKIISIIMIISFHYVYKSGYDFNVVNRNSFLIKIFWFFGELGVNAFILITGYFMINKKMSIKKIIRIVIELFFYNLLNIILRYHFLKTPIKIGDILFPVIYNRFWFVTAYLIIYLLSPYLNIFIKSMTKAEFKKFITIVLLIWCVIPTIFGLRYNSTESLLFYSRLIWFMIMYFIGAYIKLYDIKAMDTKTKSLNIAISTFIIMLCSITFIYIFQRLFNKIGTKEYAYLWMPNNIFMLILSISIFQIFSKIEMKQIKIINILASTTLGIYMLHDGSFSKFLWNDLLHTRIKLESPYCILYIIITSLLIFIIGAIIDLIRQLLEKHTVNKILELRICKKCIQKINSVLYE